MRYFFRGRVPPATRFLVIESGSRELVENLIPTLRKIWGADVQVDLVTCYPGLPQGFDGKVYRIGEYGGPSGRHKLLADLSQHGYPLTAMVCSGEPIMAKWKWWLAAKLDSKFLVVNENGDFFWLDWVHRQTILRFIMYRAGLSGSSAVPTIVRFVLFPLTLAYLILYACTVHLRRALRIKTRTL